MTTRHANRATRAWWAWCAAVLFVIYLFGFQTGFSAVNTDIQRELGLSIVELGAIAATYTWSMAILQLFGGPLLDRFGARTVLLPAIAIFTIGVFIFASAKNFGALAAAQVVLALGACVGFVGAGYVGGRWFGMAKFSVMFGLVQCVASLCSAFSQNMLAIAVARLQWRTLCTWIGIAGIAVFIVGLLCIRDRDPIAHKLPATANLPRELVRKLLAVAKIPHVWMAAGFGALSCGALLAAGVLWAPKLMVARGLSGDTANSAASILWLGLAAGCVVIPWSSDALTRRKLPAMLGIALQLFALATLVFLPRLTPTLATALWFAFGFGAAAHMLAFSAAADKVPMELIGTSAAIVDGAMLLASGLLIARPGQLVEKFATNADIDIAVRAMLPLELALAVALLLTIFIRESYPQKP